MYSIGREYNMGKLQSCVVSRCPHAESICYRDGCMCECVMAVIVKRLSTTIRERSFKVSVRFARVCVCLRVCWLAHSARSASTHSHTCIHLNTRTHTHLRSPAPRDDIVFLFCWNRATPRVLVLISLPFSFARCTRRCERGEHAIPTKRRFT